MTRKLFVNLEPFTTDRRINNMKRLLTPTIALVLVLSACGDSPSEVGTGSDADEPTAIVDDSGAEPSVDEEPIPVEPDGGIGDGAEPLPTDLDEHVITDTEIVGPKVTTPTEVVVNPDNDAELWVRFEGGDPNCTAASVMVLTETPGRVDVELSVGITTDALSRSCLADTFNLRVDVPLNESAVGKKISWSQAGSGSEAVLVTPDLSTDDFLGLTEDEARAIADENILDWRTVRVDGESFAVTEDFNPGRLNFEIDGGVITVVTLG